MDQNTGTPAAPSRAEQFLLEQDEHRQFLAVNPTTLRRYRGKRPATETDVRRGDATGVGDPVAYDFVSGAGRDEVGRSHGVHIDAADFNGFRLPVAGVVVVSGYLDMSRPYRVEARGGREAYDRGELRDCRPELVRGADDRVLKLEDLRVFEKQ